MKRVHSLGEDEMIELTVPDGFHSLDTRLDSAPWPPTNPPTKSDTFQAAAVSLETPGKILCSYS
jgi:hypothetical protein